MTHGDCHARDWQKPGESTSVYVPPVALENATS